jgi:hypothetical protein
VIHGHNNSHDTLGCKQLPRDDTSSSALQCHPARALHGPAAAHKRPQGSSGGWRTAKMHKGKGGFDRGAAAAAVAAAIAAAAGY